MNNSKFLKTLGNAAVVLSLVFVFKRLTALDIDKEIIWSGLVHVAWISFACGILVFVSCVPWKAFVRIISGRSVPFVEAAWIFSKSNMMKYLPGNVFQFIGRNELAIRLNLSHADVAFATLCETALLMIAILLTTVLLDRQGITKWLARYGFSGFYFLFIVFIVAAIVAVFLWKKHYDILQKLTAKLKVFFTMRSVKAILACSLYCSFLIISFAALFFAVLSKILQADIAYRMVPLVLSAYMLSWVAGFIVPGAPGGIGIREATLTLLLADVVPLDSALLAAVIFRFISILGDFWGLLFAWVMMTLSKAST